MTDHRGTADAGRAGDRGPVQAAAPCPATPVSSPWGPQVLRLDLPGGACWELSFHWQEDRWGHSLSLVTSDSRRVVMLASNEGTAQQAWPPSPPLQALHFQTLPDGRQVALLVGMAGRSHWSASVEPTCPKPGLRFDFACRHPAQPGWIGSTCHLAQAAFKHLDIAPLPGTQLQIAHDPGAGWAGQLRAWPAELPEQAGTRRWGYELTARPSRPAPDAAHQPL